MALTPPYDKPWVELDADQKANRLRSELQNFINFYNNMTMQRNNQRNTIVDRLDLIEQAVRNIEARLDALDLSASSDLS